MWTKNLKQCKLELIEFDVKGCQYITSDFKLCLWEGGGVKNRVVPI